MPNKLFWIVMLVGFSLSSGAQAQTPEVANPPIKTTAKKEVEKVEKPQSAAGISGPKAKFIAGSEETKKERSTRLKRECKGGVDAGACSGYTQ